MVSSAGITWRTTTSSSGVNWETAAERRITQLNISATADVPSGYVFKLDTDFDPQVSPADLFAETYLDEHGLLKNLRKEYRQKSGVTFTAPLMTFQRPPAGWTSSTSSRRPRASSMSS